jgi:hypothetical protein
MAIQDQEQEQYVRTYNPGCRPDISVICGKPVEKSGRKARGYRFYRALVYRVIDAYGIPIDQGDLEELVKTAVSRTGAAYNSETIRKAVDAALHVRSAHDRFPHRPAAR